MDIKPKFSGGDDDDDGNLNVKCLTSDVREPVFCDDDFEFEDVDDEDVLLSTRFSQIASLGTCSKKRDVSVKRLFDNSNSLNIEVKKLKVSTYDDHEKDEDDIHLSDEIIRSRKVIDKSFSSLKKDLVLLEKLFEEGKRKTREEEKRLQSIKRECCKELESKKKEASFVRRIEDVRNKMQCRIEECIKDFVVKEGQLYLLEDLIGARIQELKTKEIELNQVKGNISKEIELRHVIEKIDKDCGRKEGELKALSEKIAECTLELKAKEKDLDAISKLIGGQTEKLESRREKLLQVISVRKDDLAEMKEFESSKKRFEAQIKEHESKEKHYEGRVEEIKSKEKHVEGRVKDLESREKQLEGHTKEFESKQKQVEERAVELESKEMQLEGREKEFESKEEKFKGQVKELEFKKEHFESQLKVLESMDNQLVGRVREFETKEKEFECQMKELVSKQKHLESQSEELESKEKQLESRLKEHDSKEREFEIRVKEMEFKKNHFERQVKDFESKENQLVGREKEFESKEKEFEGNLNELVKELISKLKYCEIRTTELDSKAKQHEDRVKEHESKAREFEGHVKELESNKKHFEIQVEELKTKERQLKGQVKELESKEKQFDSRVKEFESEENEFEGRVKEFESKVDEFEGRVNDIKSRENELEGPVKDIKSKEEELEGQVKDMKLKKEELEGRIKELESEKKHFESRVKNFKSKEKQFEGLWKKLELNENKFKIKVKEFKLKEKQFGGQGNDLEAKLNKIDRQPKESELTEKQYEVLTKYIVEEKDSGLQLDTSEKTDGVESLSSGVLVNLLESPDPAKFVLDIIQNPIIPLSKKGYNAIIDDSHINLLKQLIRMSPNIKPCVREEAWKLALDLKANMKENTENSLGVLGFLLLLSIYGLVTSFVEDEILELFAFVAQHKMATELFRILGFANKVSDFVENLIKNKQFVGAVRFSCAYNLADKNQHVDLLQEHVRNAKQICETICKNNNSIEIKDKARDREIASLRTVLWCISDHGLELELKDMFSKKIKYRILELKGHQGN